MVREKRIRCDFGAIRGKLKKRRMGPQHPFIWSTGHNQYRRNKQICMNVKAHTHAPVYPPVYITRNCQYLTNLLLCSTISWFNVHSQYILFTFATFSLFTHKQAKINPLARHICNDLLGWSQVITFFPRCCKKSPPEIRGSVTSECFLGRDVIEVATYHLYCDIHLSETDYQKCEG